MKPSVTIGPSVVKSGQLWMQMCVPRHWWHQEILRFAQEQVPAPHGEWRILQEMGVGRCGQDNGYLHYIVVC